jgi:hypothetical protein
MLWLGMVKTPAIISRAEAKRRGLQRYVTGEPCKHGHMERYTRTGLCVLCDNRRSAAWRAAKKGARPPRSYAQVASYRFASLIC